MGKLDAGKWSAEWYDTSKTGGRFKRSAAQFRNWITEDGAPGPSGEGGFKAEAGRYHLYVAMACPWAHRTLVFRKLKDLEPLISVSIADPKMTDEHGWAFTGERGSTDDPVNHAAYLRDIYLLAAPDYSGRVTVPTLWDRERGTIVSNESSEIIRMFNSAFDALTGNRRDFYPAPLRPRIDEINARVYSGINNGVYKAGFATTQEAYDEAVSTLFETLDWVEGILGENRYLAGDTITEADWRLFTTLVRFDAIYVGHFKCNLRRIADYPSLSRLLVELYGQPGIADTFDLQMTKLHYYWSHDSINPYRIVPIGPEPAFLTP